ncbi:helix-turn-helix transcriptional regulator [Fulvimonas sp. R45]|uniref:response regulator transcription factor n=1 Tax=Fulvimonas sp. R45 TaxID=3045937 RepID=UPI00265EBF7A|nr:helix-turn-helix transcriptional regulator [Fulvimonas sp. R45]MDO1529820.1 helix-turn-helix transcriptional regulator [Fulvimonas sp. R45]
MDRDDPAGRSRLRLTAREREVLALVAAGHGCRAIARSFGLSVGTVKKHRSSILRKFGLHSYAGLVALALSAFPPTFAVDPERPLTACERQVVGRVALGLTTKQIAVELGISPHTVGTHRNNAMRRCGAHKMAELLAIARRWPSVSDQW